MAVGDIGSLLFVIGFLMMLIGGACANFKLARQHGNSGPWAVVYTIGIVFVAAFVYGILAAFTCALFFSDGNFSLGSSMSKKFTFAINIGMILGQITGLGFASRIAKGDFQRKR